MPHPSTHANLHQDFRAHFQQTYMPHPDDFSTGGDYTEFEPYYNFGYELALDEAFADRDYDEAEAALREEFNRRYQHKSYDHFEEAVRHAYEQTRLTLG